MSELQGFIVSRTPPGWEIRPLWSLFRRRKLTGHADEELLSVYRDYGVIPKSSRDDNHNKESEDLSSYQLVTEGSLVTNKMKAWQGSIAISRYRGIVSPAYYVYEPLSEEWDQFIHYLLRSDPYIALYARISKGVRVNQWDLEHEALRNVPVMLPDRATQKAIAAFLDRETARIDLLIEKKRVLIDIISEARLSLISRAVTIGPSESSDQKNTNNYYIPKIPSGWTIWRLKQLAEIRGGLALGRVFNEKVPISQTPYLRVANVQAGWLDLSDIAELYATNEEIEKHKLLDGDVLLNEGGDNDKLGRGAVWRAPFSPCVHQNHVFVARPFDKIYSDWISLATNAQYARDFFFLNSNQSTNLASISKTNISKFPIAMPPLNVMIEIIDYTKNAINRFNILSSNINTSITLLREYRAALITAAVTGQIDVATWGREGRTERRLDQIEEATQP